jgi:hypothetical protein
MRGAGVVSTVDGWVPGNAAAISVMINVVFIFWQGFLATSDFNHMNISDVFLPGMIQTSSVTPSVGFAF